MQTKGGKLKKQIMMHISKLSFMYLTIIVAHCMLWHGTCEDILNVYLLIKLLYIDLRIPIGNHVYYILIFTYGQHHTLLWCLIEVISVCLNMQQLCCLIHPNRPWRRWCPSCVLLDPHSTPPLYAPHCC